MAKKSNKTDKDYSTELIPPEGTEDVGLRVFEILHEILQDKANLGLPNKWIRHYKLSKNKHWQSTSKRASFVSANLLFRHRQQTVNMLTDNNPTFNVTKMGDPDQYPDDIYDDLLHTAQHWWIDQEQQGVLGDSIQNGEMYGCTIEKSIFNTELEFGTGEIESVVVDPFNFGIYPVECQKVQKAEAVLHFWPMSVREARRRWPEQAKEIQSDEEYLKKLGDERREVQSGGKAGSGGYWATFSGVVKQILSTISSEKAESDEVLVCECWVKDRTEIVDKEELTKIGTELLDENPEIDLADELSRYNVVKPKYPGFIRRIQSCNGGNIVLSDEPNPSINPNLDIEQAQKTYLYDKFPFSFTQSITDTSNAWGMSDYEQLEGLNLELDKALSQFNLAKDKISRLKLINPKDTGVENKQFTNYPGIINPTNKMTADGIRYLEPPPIDPHLTGAIDLYRDFFFLVAGSFELDQAQTPGKNVIAYKAIAALLERAATMQRGKIRNYSKMIRERGRMFLSHVMNWYTESRWIDYDEDGQRTQKQIGGLDGKLIVPAKLTVVSGSTMPVSKVQEREEAIALYKDNAIDNEELLKKLEWPDRKNVIKRMKAGPFGELFEKLKTMGAPEAFLMIAEQIANMDMKEFEKAMKDQELPMFEEIVVEPEEGKLPEPDISPTEQAEAQAKIASAQEKLAKAERERAEIQLISEKIVTERVEQQVKLEGIEFDKDKMKTERAKVINEIASVEEDRKIKRAETILNLTKSSEEKGTAPYKEKGLKSNNEEV